MKHLAPGAYSIHTCAIIYHMPSHVTDPVFSASQSMQRTVF
jgi:hypothetical protein